MKSFSNLIATFAMLLVTVTFAVAQIPNAGFEIWSNASGYNTPTDWENLNAMTAPTGIYTCSKGTPGSVGTSYIKLVSKNVGGMGVMPGIAISGKLNTATLQPKSGFAYAQRPTALTGKWQHMAAGADGGFIKVELTRWDAAMNMRMTVASTTKPLGNMVMAWASFSIPITYTSSEMPDSCTITLSASGAMPVANSYLYVDDLGFAGVTATNQNTAEIGDFKLFPNPAITYISLDKTALIGKMTNATIIDMQGRAVQNLNTETTNWANIDVADLPKGTYFIKITTDKGVITQKFTKL